MVHKRGPDALPMVIKIDIVAYFNSKSQRFSSFSVGAYRQIACNLFPDSSHENRMPVTIQMIFKPLPAFNGCLCSCICRSQTGLNCLVVYRCQAVKVSASCLSDTN